MRQPDRPVSSCIGSAKGKYISWADVTPQPLPPLLPATAIAEPASRLCSCCGSRPGPTCSCSVQMKLHDLMHFFHLAGFWVQQPWNVFMYSKTNSCCINSKGIQRKASVWLRHHLSAATVSSLRVSRNACPYSDPLSACICNSPGCPRVQWALCLQKLFFTTLWVSGVLVRVCVSVRLFTIRRQAHH